VKPYVSEAQACVLPFLMPRLKVLLEKYRNGSLGQRPTSNMQTFIQLIKPSKYLTMWNCMKIAPVVFKL